MRIELLSRCWLPGIGWIRSHHEYLWCDVNMGMTSTANLPPFMFSLNAASLARLVFEPHGGRMTIGLQLDSVQAFRLQDWRESRLWSQVTFPSPYWYSQEHEVRPYPSRARPAILESGRAVATDPRPPDRLNRSPWWLRWRCPDADHDIMSVVQSATMAIHDHADDPTEVRSIAGELAREIVMWQLGGPVPSRVTGALD